MWWRCDDTPLASELLLGYSVKVFVVFSELAGKKKKKKKKTKKKQKKKKQHQKHVLYLFAFSLILLLCPSDLLRINRSHFQAIRLVAQPRTHSRLLRGPLRNLCPGGRAARLVDGPTGLPSRNKRGQYRPCPASRSAWPIPIPKARAAIARNRSRLFVVSPSTVMQKLQRFITASQTDELV